MTPSMNVTLTAIGRQLQADFASILDAPLPGEIEHQLERLVARETGMQEPTEQPRAQS